MLLSDENIAFYISLLKGFPPHKKTKGRRQAYLKAKHLDNKKIFFTVFIQKITQERYNMRDKKRRLQGVSFLPIIFNTIKPKEENNKFIFKNNEWTVIVKKEKEAFQLLSLYPT